MATDNYRSQLEVEAERWSDHAEARQVKRSWMQSPLVLEHVNRRVTGDPNLDWLQWVNRNYLVETDRKRALSLGCNDGNFERQLVASGVVGELLGIDISPRAIALAEAESNREGLTAHFEVGDVNTIRLEPGSYDVVFSVMAMHHFENLDHVLNEVSRALKPNGLLVLNEYVGASRFQWPEEQVSLANSVLKLIPPHWRQLRDGSIREVLIAPPLDAIRQSDPFEAIRSAEIRSSISQWFQVAAVLDYGGSILHQVLHDIVHNFDETVEEDRNLLRMLCGIEDLLLEQGCTESDFTVIVARKRSIDWTREPLDAEGVAATTSRMNPYFNDLAQRRIDRSLRTSSPCETQRSLDDAVARLARMAEEMDKLDRELADVRRHLRLVKRGKVLRLLNAAHGALKQLGRAKTMFSRHDPPPR